MKTRWLVSIAIGIGFVLIVVLLTGQAISAAPQVINTFNVNSTADAVDDNPGNGVCHTAAGTCTLRAAVMEAVRLTTSVTINVPSGTYILSIPPITPTDGITNGDLNLLPPPGPYLIGLTINGAGMNSTIIDGNHLDRVFDVSSGRIAGISNLTIRNGSVPIYQNGGGLSNAGSLFLDRVRVYNNSAVGGLGGGGIYNNNRLTIFNSQIDGNSVPYYGGGIVNDSGGSLHIYNSAIFNNHASSAIGGGIFDYSGQAVNLIMSNTAVYSNTAYDGGGLGDDWNTGSPMRIYNSAIYNNSAQANGGGIELGDFNGGSVHLVNTTLSGNTAGHNGGAIALETSGSQVQLYNSTLAYNTAGSSSYLGHGGAIASLAGAVFTSEYSIFDQNFDYYTTTFFNTVVTNPQDNPCYGTIYTLFSAGDNIMSNYDTARCHITGSGRYLIDPNIGPLQNNGGSTWTHALLPGSPAIDQGLYCSDEYNYLLTDQRGYARFVDGFCDLGAYESGTWTYLPLTLKIH